MMSAMPRFDMDHLAVATLAETAEQLAVDKGPDKPVSREGIRKIQARALAKLARGLEQAGYTLEDLLP
jgi:hypothetical protein